MAGRESEARRREEKAGRRDWKKRWEENTGREHGRRDGKRRQEEKTGKVDEKR